MATHDPHQLPPNLPVPRDDGRARHLTGLPLPRLELQATNGRSLRLDELAREPTLFFFYPRTGVPGQPPSRGFAGEDWDEIPGARGCTPQSCAFRDRHLEFARLGVSVFGVSTQSTEFQVAFKARNHVPFEYLSDVDLSLVTTLGLPTFEFPVESGGPNTLIARMAWFAFEGRIAHVWYPVFPPQENAARVLVWLEEQLPFFRGVEREGITYRREPWIDPEELGALFRSSGIGRPHDDHDRLASMLGHSNLLLTARERGALVGVARSLTDFSWCAYLSDLAVGRDHQGRGIGRRLVELSKRIVGPRCTLVLVAAPNAASYYPHIGLEPISAAFRIPRKE